MKKIAFAFVCIAMALATMSCSKKTNNPDSIDLTKYDSQEAAACWAVTAYQGSAEATTYTWSNEYFIAAGCKASLEMVGGAGVSYSWKKVDAANEQACEDKNVD